MNVRFSTSSSNTFCGNWQVQKCAMTNHTKLLLIAIKVELSICYNYPYSKPNPNSNFTPKKVNEKCEENISHFRVT